MLLALAMLVACAPEDTGAPSYYSDVKPIMDGYCVSCHAADSGITPWVLTSYEDIEPIKALIAEEVVAKRMPPWGAEPGHTPLKYDVSLSDAQIDTLVAWSLDPQLGDPAEEGPAIELDRGGLERIDHELPMAFEYTPQGTPDDYRCFALDWPEDEVSYITGFVGLPGNTSVVHHLLTFMVGADQADLVRSFDGLYPDAPGWPCFGGPTPSEGYDGEGVFGQMLGTWAPGMAGMTLPEGTGMPVSAGSVPVLQVHYNTLTSQESDLSALGVQLSDTPVTPGFVLPFFDIQWYMNPSSMAIPAGEEDVVHSYEALVAENTIFKYLGLDSTGAEVHSVFPHMHQLGTAISVYTEQPEREREYLVNVPAYDFDWQREYVFQDSLFAAPEDVLGIECHWNNTEAFRIQRDVSPTEPMEVGWGEGTVDEMCIATMYITFP